MHRDIHLIYMSLGILPPMDMSSAYPIGGARAKEKKKKKKKEKKKKERKVNPSPISVTPAPSPPTDIG